MNRTMWMLFLAYAAPASAFAQGEARLFRKADIAPQGTVSVSLEFDRIFTRDLEDSSVTGVKTDDVGVVVDMLDVGTAASGVELESNAVYARIAYTLFAAQNGPFAIEGYVLLGGADLQLDGIVTSPGDPAQAFNIDGDFGLLVGGGARSRVYSRDQLNVFVDGSVRFSEHDSSITSVSNLDLDFDPTMGESITQDFEMSLLAWQISAYASYELELAEMTVAPYAGIRFSGVEIDVDGSQTFLDPAFDGRQTIDYQPSQDDVFGIVAGVEVGFSDNISGFIEIRVIDEVAVTAGASITF